MQVSHPCDAGQAFCDGIGQVENFLTAACDHYERSAPTVADHCNGLYIRIQDGLPVTVREIMAVCALCDRDGWVPPNYAANAIYKLRQSLGMDTTGHAGF